MRTTIDPAAFAQAAAIRYGKPFRATEIRLDERKGGIYHGSDYVCTLHWTRNGWDPSPAKATWDRCGETPGPEMLARMFPMGR